MYCDGIVKRASAYRLCGIWHLPCIAGPHFFDAILLAILPQMRLFKEVSMLLNGSQIFVKVLLEQGVDTIFGYPGGAVLNLYDELYKNSDKIRHILTAHEQGAAHAADGYARTTGKTGVVLATSGPGATNLVTGLATAKMDSVPVVAFTGNVGTKLLGKDSFQEVAAEKIMAPVTKRSFTVMRVEDLASTMRLAFKIAKSGRHGPVSVDIPKDVTANTCEYEPMEPEPVSVKNLPDVSKMVRAISMINSARRPVIMIGGGVKNANATDLIRRFVHTTGIPVTHTLMGAGEVRYDDELNLGLLGMHGKFSSNKAVAEADLLISIGTRFSDRVALNPDTFAGKAKVIQIDVDIDELGKNVDVDLAIVSDAATALEVMLSQVKAPEISDWIAQIREWQKNDFVPQRSEDSIHPQQLIEEICDECGPDAHYVTDVGQHQMWAAQYIKHVDPRRFVTSGGLGTMGYGYGAAIGTQVALGNDSRVVMLTGDGSFHMNMNEACTAVSYNLPIITVIFDNKVLGMVRQWQKLFYGGRYSQTDPGRKTDYVKVAEGFGLKGYSVSTMPEFREAFAKALQNDGPTWIQCIIDKDEKVLPMIPGGHDVSDIRME